MNYREENRIFLLEGTDEDHLVQLPDQFRADQKLKDVVEKENRAQGERT